MELFNNMEFEMKSTFIPNISHSDRLRILEVNTENVVVQMENSNCRGVFPLDNFHYWIRKNSLVHINEEEEKTS